MYKMNVQTVLNTVFGFSSFKKNQEEIVSSLLKGQDVFAAMPTGGGKSLCYQLPSLILPGVTVVISPLIALMKDQTEGALQHGIAAACINSSLPEEDTIRVYRELHQGKIKLLYISPERFALTSFTVSLKELNISLIAVDEAHCLSEWGHDFRPDYLSLCRIRELFPDTIIAAFTATATRQVQEDIIRKLRLKNPLVVRASFDRPELSYRIVKKLQVNNQLLRLLKERQGKAGIVYRTSRKDVEKTAAFLVKNNIKALPYHAGLSDEERALNQEKFNNDEVDVIVATIAFGMGIDKSNISYVIHGDLPKNIEGYYQETGRAGRDGSDSECILLFSRGDCVKLNYFIERMPDPNEQHKARQNLHSMVRYATGNVCRRKQLLSYFEEEHPGECSNCDICNNENEEEDISIEAQKFLSAVIRTGESFGITHIIDVLRGSANARVMKFRHNEIKTYGVGKDRDKIFWHSVVDELLAQECLFQDIKRYNALVLTNRGYEVLYGRDKLFMLKTEDPVIEAPQEILTGDEKLFESLRGLRREIAKEKSVPPYVVFSDKTLKEMSFMKPETSEDFLLITGVGEKKLKEYGEMFLKEISRYLEEL